MAAVKMILQIQIVAFRQEGIDRVAAHNHPRIDGVKWLVSLQTGDRKVSVPASLSERDDFTVIVHEDTGVARNRNHALDFPDNSDWVLFSDDDADYSDDGVHAVLEAIKKYGQEANVLCFRYLSNGCFVKNYGDDVTDLRKPPRGWYPSTLEMAFRRDAFPVVRFNEFFGPGSGRFMTGEDTVWFSDVMRRKQARALLVPVTVCNHDSDSTGIRMKNTTDFIKAHGSMMFHLKPVTWAPRLVVHALRSDVPFVRYMKNALSGVADALRYRVFDK